MAKTTMQSASEDRCTSPLKINVVGVNRELRKAIIFNPRCKKWSCPYCAEQNRMDWVHVAHRGATILTDAGALLRFVTVTSRPHATVNQSLYFFKQNWPKLMRRAAYHTRKHNIAWAYILVPERHKSGKLHAHAVIATDLKTRWWKDNAFSCGFGYMAESKPVKENGYVVAYVTKYIGKSMELLDWPKGFRRVRTSKAWPKPDKVVPPGWEYSTHNDESAWFEYYMLKDYGYTVEDRRRFDKET